MTKGSVIRAGIVAVLLSTTNAAFAADFIPEEPAPVVPIFTWTGFYLGVVGGYNWGKTDYSFENDATANHHANGGTIGGTVGYNYQFYNNVVLGLETDLAWLGAKGGTDCPNPVFSCDSKTTWLGTLRPRLGYAYDRFLPYITAGAAYGRVEISTLDRSNDIRVGSSSTRFGWAAGVGLEYAFTDQFTAKVEYLHTDLGNDDFGVSAGDVVRAKWRGDAVRVGFNYKF